MNQSAQATWAMLLAQFQLLRLRFHARPVMGM